MMMNKSIGFLSLLLLFVGIAFGQNLRNDSFVDSSLQWLNDHYVDYPSDFHNKALETLSTAYQTEDQRLIGEAHFVLMRWHAYHVLFTIDSIFYHGEKAIEIFKEIQDEEKLATTYAELAFEYIDEDLERSESLVIEAIKIHEAYNDQKMLGYDYQVLSSVALAQEEPQTAIKYGLQAIELASKAKDYITLGVVWQELIKAYHLTGDLEKALEAGNNCIETVLNKAPEDVFTLARAYRSRSDVWIDLNNYEKALEDGNLAYATVEKHIGAARPAAQTYRRGIGLAYYKMGQYENAIPHLEACIKGYKDLGQAKVPKIQKLYDMITDCYAQIGDYRNGFDYLSEAYQVQNYILNKKIENLEAESLIKFETSKKDQAIAEQQFLLSQKTKIQRLGLGIIGLLVLFLSTLFYYFRRNKKIADELKVKNEENELLLKEIHHRVKNNLQTISSLLSLQSESMDDEAAIEAVRESQNRVASMALIHQKLYQGDNLASIEMRNYFKTMGQAVIDGFGNIGENVDLQVDMAPLEMDVEAAIPIGLITNELMTNSLKYAFPNKKGKISIQLKALDNNLYELVVADDGVGKVDSEMTKNRGFGSLLVNLLNAQIQGKMEVTSEHGTAVRIQFPPPLKSAI